jgi:hypothetical protein
MKKRMFKRAQTFLSVLRRKLTQTFNYGGHLGHHRRAVAAPGRVRLRLVLGVVGPSSTSLRQSAADAAVLVVDEAAISSTK